jgi:hypothetical protein
MRGLVKSKPLLRKLIDESHQRQASHFLFQKEDEEIKNLLS